MEGKIIFMAAASDQDCFCIVTLTPGSEKPWFLLVCHACSSSSLWSMLYIFAINYFYFLLLVTRNHRRFTVIITIQTVFVLHWIIYQEFSHSFSHYSQCQLDGLVWYHDHCCTDKNIKGSSCDLPNVIQLVRRQS